MRLAFFAGLSFFANVFQAVALAIALGGLS